MVARAEKGKTIEVSNAEAVDDIAIYSLGTLKNLTLSPQNSETFLKSLGTETIGKLMSEVLGREEGKKKAQILVQAVAIVRNLAGNDKSVEILLRQDVLHLLLQTLGLYPDHNELVLNIWRFLSKISVQDTARHELYLLGEKFVNMALKSLKDYNSHTLVLIRIAFVLGNLTTLYEDSMLYVGKNGLNIIFDCLKVYWGKDESSMESAGTGKTSVRNNSNSNEDALTKLIRVLANVLTSTKVGEVLRSTYLTET